MNISKCLEYSIDHDNSIAAVAFLVGIAGWVMVFIILLASFIKWEISYETIRALIAFFVLAQVPTVFMFFHKRIGKDD